MIPKEETVLEIGVPAAMRNICKRCGNFRAHRQPCLYCTIEGNYKTREIHSETMKVAIEWARSLPKGHELRDYIEHHLFVAMPRRRAGAAAKDRRTPSQLTTAGQRMMRGKQLRLCTLLLLEITKLFEVDQFGDLQIYEDRLEEARAWVKMVQRVIPEVAASFRIDIKSQELLLNGLPPRTKKLSDKTIKAEKKRQEKKGAKVSKSKGSIIKRRRPAF